jgi:hypothetical protein
VQDLRNHLWNLIETSWELVKNSLSTSTLSIVISISVPIVIFLIRVFAKWSKSRRSWADFRTTLREQLGFGVLVTVGIELFVGLCLLSWAVYRTVYNDHQNLAGRLQAVVREKDELKNGLRVRDEYIQRLKDENTKLHTVPRTATVATVINAPGGIPIVGNKGTVEHPTVNNYGPIPRRLLDQTKKELSDCLRKKVGRFSIGAIQGNGEAYKYAKEWRGLFISAGWEIEHKDIPIQIFMIGGGTWSGMQFRVHDASTVQGQMTLADDSPEQNFKQCVSGRSDISGGGNIIPYKDFPTGSVGISVSYQP